MSSTAQNLFQRHRLTVEDYHRMGQAGILREGSRVELIEGEIVDMTPVGSCHAATVKKLVHLFSRAIGDSAIISVQDPIILDDHSEPEPDIALLQPKQDFYASGHPQPASVLLLVEVADSSLRYDREVKIPIYARHGIPEVWLVDLNNKQLTLFTGPRDSGYQNEVQHDHNTPVTPLQLPELELDLSSLFAPQSRQLLT